MATRSSTSTASKARSAHSHPTTKASARPAAATKTARKTRAAAPAKGATRKHADNVVRMARGQTSSRMAGRKATPRSTRAA